MEIKIGTVLKDDIEVEVFWNTELPYQEQTDDAKSCIASLCVGNCVTTSEMAGHYPRVLTETYSYSAYDIVKTYVYQYPPDSAENGLIKEITYNLITK